MWLAVGNDVSIPSATETEICQWTADGVRQVVGFFASAVKGGQARYYEGGIRKITVDIAYSGEEPYLPFISKPYVPANGTIISLRFLPRKPERADCSGGRFWEGETMIFSGPIAKAAGNI